MKQLFAALLLVCNLTIHAQVIPPYATDFDNLPADTVGWRHYAISGTDDWELGTPTFGVLDFASTPPNCWKTNLDGYSSSNSNKALESPTFNFTNLPTGYVLEFYHIRYSTASSDKLYLEYSTNGGGSWQLLDNATATKKNWQTASGFSLSSYNNYQHAAININFLQGQPNVKFRFRYLCNGSSMQGWAIDDFAVRAEYYNYYTTANDTMHATRNCSNLSLKTFLGFTNQYTTSYSNTTKYYFSHDAILDAGDSLLATKTGNVTGNVTNYTQAIGMIQGLSPGNYYILYHYDALNALTEANENDNIGRIVLTIDPILTGTYITDFETLPTDWYAAPNNIWALGKGIRPHIEDAHSGNYAWHTSNTLTLNSLPANSYTQKIISPILDLTTITNPTLTFWFKTNYKNGVGYSGNLYTIYYNTSCDGTGPWTVLDTIKYCTDDEWDFYNKSLATLAGQNSIRFAFNAVGSYTDSEGIIFDDLYIGPPKADLTIERDKSNRYTPTTLAVDTLPYMLANSGLAGAPQTITRFYWSTDTIFDNGDVLLGSQQEPVFTDSTAIWKNFIYTKPTQQAGKYYLFYFVDYGASVSEIWENNNSGYFTLYQSAPYSLPYTNNFETQTTNWRHNKSLGADQWNYLASQSTLADSGFYGTKAWIMADIDTLIPLSRMHLYSPIFDFTTLTKPVVEFDMLTLAGNGYHATNMSYSTDGGATWIVLDTTSQSYNCWYYVTEYDAWGGVDHIDNTPGYTPYLFDAAQEHMFTNSTQYNSREADRNTHYVLDVEFLAGKPQVQFRFNTATGRPAVYTQTGGLLIDNFKISQAFIDLRVNYRRSLMISSLANSFYLDCDIKNDGNYMAEPFNVRFYVSTDTIIDANDPEVMQSTANRLRPDLYSHIAGKATFSGSGQLADYTYLLYKVDYNNTVPESNENNNTGYWLLGIDSIRDYPYVQDFSDTLLNGWRQYTIDRFGVQKNTYRFRNTVAPGEALYSSGRLTGQLWTDQINPAVNISSVPFWYVETPAFDFTAIDSIMLSFDLFCYGPGNFDYSLDGGNTWTVILQTFGESLNWYYIGAGTQANLNNQQGWTFVPNISMPPLPTPFDSVAMDLSSLRDKKSVLFRYKYRGNPQATMTGMRVDNFTIYGSKIDYVVDTALCHTYIPIGQQNVPLQFQITNAGQHNGRPGHTRFYYSTDAIFDAQDSLLGMQNTTVISTGTTYNGTFNFNLPQNSTLPFYVFYVADADSNLVETNEANNMGVCMVSYFIHANYLPAVPYDSLNALVANPVFPITYKAVNNGSVNGNISQTYYYWSADSVLDAGDAQFSSTVLNAIASGDTVVINDNITYPTPLTQAVYHLFYTLDGAQLITEDIENDNTGHYKVTFDYVDDINQSTYNGLGMYYANSTLVIQSDRNITNGLVKLVNMAGQIICTLQTTIAQGNTIIQLPCSLPTGVYIAMLQTNGSSMARKLVVTK